MKITFILLFAALVVSGPAGVVAAEKSGAPEKPLGYQDTPIIPGTKWHVHDGQRPQPKVVTPGTFSTQEQVGKAPSDAVVLFDGKDLSKWRGAKGAEAKWKVENGYMEINNTGDIWTKDEFGPDMQVHVEWASPAQPSGSGQGGDNSGLFFFDRYEIQVLNSYVNKTYPDGQAAAIYGQTPPLVNASAKPGEWQVYDIIFNGPRFKDGKLEKPAYVTVFHNGVVVQNHTEYLGETMHKKIGPYREHPEKGAIRIQDHKNPVRFRSIWIRELKPVDSQ